MKPQIHHRLYIQKKKKEVKKEFKIICSVAQKRKKSIQKHYDWSPTNYIANLKLHLSKIN